MTEPATKPVEPVEPSQPIVEPPPRIETPDVEPGDDPRYPATNPDPEPPGPPVELPTETVGVEDPETGQIVTTEGADGDAQPV